MRKWASGSASLKMDEVGSGRASTVPRPVSMPTKNPQKTPRLARTGVRHKGILRVHPLLYLGIEMGAMLALWALLANHGRQLVEYDVGRYPL